MRHRHRHNPQSHALLWVACALMTALFVSDCASLAQAFASWSSAAFSLLDDALFIMLDVLANLFCVCLEAACIARALHVVHLDAEDTHDHVATSQLLAIALLGLTVVEWSVASLTSGYFDSPAFARMIVSLVPCIVYYRAIGKESHSPFWQGIRNAGPDEPPIECPAPPESLVIDDGGRLVPGGEAEGGAVSNAGNAPAPARVHVYDLRGFAREHSGTDLAARATRVLGHISRTAVYPLGDGVLGTLYIPAEKLDMTGPALGGEAHLGFYLTPGELALVADDEPTQRLLAWYLERQYLAKQALGEVLIELQELLIEDDGPALSELDGRIDLLEDSLSDGVSEVPRDFSDYVNDTRHDLGVVEKFYRQLSDAADDALADDVLVSGRVRHLLAGLSRRAESLAGDAQELRDYLNQVREGYQERVNVRQNGIMSILTIVTAISTPVALIAGWYGMNFSGMAELRYPGAYGMVIIVCVVIVTAEVLYFKRKRWF